MHGHERRRLCQADPRSGRPGRWTPPPTPSSARASSSSTTPTPTASRWPSSWPTRRGGDEVILVSMAPNGETSGLRTALAMGAGRAILVSDDALAGSDALGTAKVLAAAIKRAEPDLVLAATESTDGYTGTTPGPGGRAARPALGHLRQEGRRRRPAGEGRAPDRGRLRRGRVPAARRGHRDRRRGRAPLPVVQGDHGGQVQAGRHPDGGRPRGRRRSGRAAPAPARRSPTSPTPRPAVAGRSWWTRATAPSASSPSSRS